MKRWLSIWMIVTLSVALCGCNAEKENHRSEELLSENIIHLFLSTDDGVVRSDTDYQLKTPDSLPTSVEEVMTALMAEGDGGLASYTYMIGEDNALSLTLVLSGTEKNKESTLMMMAAVTKTMFQLDDISSIQLVVEDKDSNQLASQSILRNSIYYYGYNDYSLSGEDVCVYMPNADKKALEKKIVKEQTEPDVSDQELIVMELVNQGMLPSGTRVNLVSVHGSNCYLDLSKEFMEGVSGIASELIVYSLVNSIIEQSGFETVQILIDGETVNSYRNSVDISKPLGFNSDVVE